MLLLVRGYNAEKNLCLTAPIWPVKHDKDMEPWEDMNDKSKPALSLVTPQARHHYTRFDQVDQLVGASETDPEMGFMTRLLALCNLPRTNPGDRLQYKRVNGPYKLVMIAGADNKLPYGTIPRLLLAWVCTEAVRTQSRELILGSSLSEFMRKLDIYNTSGGPTGGRTRLRNQMDRLFHAQVSLVYEDERGKMSVSSLVADRTEFWWNPKRDVVLFRKSSCCLGEIKTRSAPGFDLPRRPSTIPSTLNLHSRSPWRRSSNPQSPVLLSALSQFEHHVQQPSATSGHASSPGACVHMVAGGGPTLKSRWFTRMSGAR